MEAANSTSVQLPVCDQVLKHSSEHNKTSQLQTQQLESCEHLFVLTAISVYAAIKEDNLWEMQGKP